MVHKPSQAATHVLLVLIMPHMLEARHCRVWKSFVGVCGKQTVVTMRLLNHGCLGTVMHSYGRHKVPDWKTMLNHIKSGLRLAINREARLVGV